MKFLRQVPMLATENMDATTAFYRDVLGFELGDKFESGGTVWWCEMKRDAVTLMFTQHETDTHAPGARDGFEQTSINFYVDDVVDLYERVQQHGSDVSEMRVTFYKVKEFHTRDPSGYTLLFGQATDEEPTVDNAKPAPF